MFQKTVMDRYLSQQDKELVAARPAMAVSTLSTA